MGARPTREYARLVKAGFLLGLGLFLFGAVGQLVGATYFGPLPDWEATLLFDLEAVGLVVGFFSPIVFGIALPLLER